MPAPYETHRAQLKAILLAWGMPEENAETTADILGWADLHGVDSHGISMLPGYDRLRRAGRANMSARPRIIKETPVSALVDGDGGLGHVSARFAMQVAIDKAKQSGMAIAAVRNSAHFGATGYYTLMAAKEGLPSTDPLEAREKGGFLTSLGGSPENSSYKGYGLAVMVNILGSCLSGASLITDPKKPPGGDVGHCFVAIDPGLFRDREEFAADVTRFCNDLRATKPVDPRQPVMVAGDPQWNKAKQRLQEGIPVGPGLLNQVRQIAQACAAPWLLD